MATIDQNVKCPKCGSGMVLRTARKGMYSGKQFYGCSRHPRCNGIQNYSPAKAAKSADTTGHSQTATATPPKIVAESPKVPLTDFQKKELKRLRDRLLNVSSRNRSIRLSRLDKKSAFDLYTLNEFDPELTGNLIEHCLKSEKDVPLLPEKNVENEELWTRVSERLTHLDRHISEIQRETGLHDLYIGFPFIGGRPAGTETVIQAPIFLIPVNLGSV